MTRAQTNEVLRLAEAFTEAQQENALLARERGVTIECTCKTTFPCPTCRVLILSCKLAAAVRDRQNREYVI